MYINPMLAGALTVVMVELIAIITISIIANIKNKGGRR